MNGSLYLSACKATALLRFRIIRTMYNCDLAVLILLKACTFYKICTHQTYFIAWEESEILLGRFFHKVISVDIEFTAEWNLSGAKFFILQIVSNFQIFNFSFRIVINY